MNLIYNESVPGLANTPAFNGNISAMKWSTNQGLGVNLPALGASEVRERAYAFGYDPMNRLLSASHRAKNSNDAWNAVDDFNEDNLSYDLNGNILTLNRNGENASPMDRLGYSYVGNQLQDVHDGPEKDKGFVDGNATTTDYVYDANGNMIVDRNKFIKSITYNHLNLPATVTKKNGEHINYVYDASGRKLSQGVYGATGVLKKKTDYAGEFFYENDTLKFINHEEGRVVMTDAEPEYQYHMKDHLGNVRLTFTSKQEMESATATVEPDNMAAEKSKFIYYEEAVVVNSQIFDHTNDNAVDPEGYSMRLTGGIHHQYGLAKSLSVMPGDTVKMSVFAKYVKPTSQGTWPADIAGLMNDLANPGSGLVVDGKLAGSIGGGVFPFLGLMQRTEDPDTVPKAYLNYIVFDQRDTLVDFGYVRVNQDAYETGTNGDHQHLFHDLVIRQPGYVYIYLSNENETPVDVFFDDFKIEHIKSPVVAVDDYYPFGLTFNSYQRENSLDQKYKFQGQEHIDDLDLGWDSFKWRNHMPDIGRFFNVDPLAEKYLYNSPYAFSENKVTSHVELEGLEAVIIHGTTQTATGPSFSSAATKELQRIGGNTKADASFRWDAPLLNKEADRKVAAGQLASHVSTVRNEMIESGQITSDEPVTLVGYSHGGNVAIQAVEQISKELGVDVNLITVSTPAYNDAGDNENPAGKSGINQHIQIIHENDGVADGPALGNDTYTNGNTANYVVPDKEVPVSGSGSSKAINAHTELPGHGKFDDYLKTVPTMSKPKQ